MPRNSNSRIEDLRQIASTIATTAQNRDVSLDERELVTLFFEQGFFSALGYAGLGEDIRLEEYARGRNRVDLVLRSSTGRPLALIEFKRPGTDLGEHVNQLRNYAQSLFPSIAILTNGVDFWLYRVQDGDLEEPPQKISLLDLELKIAQEIFVKLRRREINWISLSDVKHALNEIRSEPIPVLSPESIGGRQFLQRFSLSFNSPFGRLVYHLHKILPLLINSSEFAKGAYLFWRQTYAREISKKSIPSSWRTFLFNQRQESLYQFMFSLETAYVFLSRALLAKAMSDAGFPYMDSISAFESVLESRHIRGQIEPEVYLYGARAVFEQAARQAFRSLFESDIFDWWHDAHLLSDIRLLTEGVAEALLALFEFDFSGLRGDLLGHLYQSYFDPETRKALGEFYTPPEVVDFILDQVNYGGEGIRTKRLLDPACGSGTFIVHALQRYFEATSGISPEEILHELLEGLRVVGFDVNPFAVLMAQVNYAAHILPLYAQAIRENPSFVLDTIPIFRTDSLRRELREAEEEDNSLVQEDSQPTQRSLQLRYTRETVYVTIDLPVRISDTSEEFLQVRVPIPNYSEARRRGLVNNIEEYFQVLRALFSAVKEEIHQESELVDLLLSRRIIRPENIASYLWPSVQEISQIMERLRSHYHDGRFLRTLEDIVLALLLKNDFKFSYIVGNPPYVRIQNIPERLRKYWLGRYDWTEGNYDIYIPFIERAVTEWLSEGGYLGFICSDRFLLVNYAQSLREKLPKHVDIHLIFDMRDTRVFRDALNYPAILILQRTSRPESKSFIAARAFADPEDGAARLIEEAEYLINHTRTKNAYFRGKHVDAFLYKKEHLSPQGWYLMPERERKVFEKIKKKATHRLQDLTLTQSGGFQGMATGLDDILILQLVQDEGEVFVLKPKGGGEPVRIERDLLRPWLFGRDVERWHIAWAGWYVFFPYMRVGNSYQLIPSRAYRNRFNFAVSGNYRGPFIDEDYPLAWAYVTRHEEKLRNRENGRYRRGRRDEHLWYGAARPQNLDYYVLPKILLQVSSTAPDFAFDVNGDFVFAAGGTSGVYGIVFKDEIPVWFILALLNSSILDFYLKHVSTIYSGHSYSYGDQFIKNLPIRLPQNRKEENIAHRLSNLAQDLTYKKGILRKLEQKRENFPESFLPEMDQAELYPLSCFVTGHPQARNITITNVKFRRSGNHWEMNFGRSTLTISSEAHVRLIEAWLRVQSRSSVPVEALLNLRVPERPEEIMQLLDLLASTEAEIERLKTELAEGEDEIDCLVAKLYDLSFQDLDIIWDFLLHF